jgi:hypothetical protein
VTDFFFDNLHTVSSFSNSAHNYYVCPWEKGFPLEDGFFSSVELVSLNRYLSQPIHLDGDRYFVRLISNFESFCDSWNRDIDKAPVSWFSHFFVWDIGTCKRFIDPGGFFTDLLLMLTVLLKDMDSEESTLALSSINKSNVGQFALKSEMGNSTHLDISPILNPMLVPHLRIRLEEVKGLLQKTNMTKSTLSLMGKYIHQKIVFATQPADSAEDAIYYEDFFGPMEVGRYTASFKLKYPSTIYSNEWMPRGQ